MYVVTPVYARYVWSASRRKMRVFNTCSRFPICVRFPFLIIFFLKQYQKPYWWLQKRAFVYTTHILWLYLEFKQKTRSFTLESRETSKDLFKWKSVRIFCLKWQVFIKHINTLILFLKTFAKINVFGKNLSFHTKHAHIFSFERIYRCFKTLKSKNARFFAWIPNTLIECESCKQMRVFVITIMIFGFSSKKYD